jgi:alpha-pyrone synthase
MVIETRTRGAASAADVASRPRPRERESERPHPRAERSAILAVGTAVPGAGRSQMELVEFMKRAHRADPKLARRLDVLYRHSGIETRYSCLEDYGRDPDAFTFYPPSWAPGAPLPTTSDRMAIYRRAGLPLARAAVDAALARVPGIDLARVSHLVVASCTGFNAPGLDVELTRSLGLARSVARTLVGFQGCHAGLTCLRLADGICRADPEALVLVVCLELCTLHLQITPSEDNLLANSLFGDGASALLVAGAKASETASEADGSGGSRLEITSCGSWLEPGTEGEMAWEVGETGFQMRLSGLVPRILGVNVGQFLATVLALEPAVARELDFWAVHPGGPAILDQVERSLGLAPEKLAESRAVLRDCGNMSSPTVFFVLERILTRLDRQADGAPARGAALAFGPGLTLEAVRFETAGTPG